MTLSFSDPPEDFRYTNQGECVQIEDVDDQSDFSAIREALGMLGFHDNQQQYMFQVLAAILHLGNVEIGSDSQLGRLFDYSKYSRTTIRVLSRIVPRLPLTAL